MALTKLCRCGRKIPIDKDTCDACSNRHARYDVDRDKDVKKFYSSARWTKLSEVVRAQANYLDLYELHVNNRLVPCNMVHHIVPVKDNWDKRYDIDNLIPLSNATHEMIERVYGTNEEKKIEMQDRLRYIRTCMVEGEV